MVEGSARGKDEGRASSQSSSVVAATRRQGDGVGRSRLGGQLRAGGATRVTMEDGAALSPKSGAG